MTPTKTENTKAVTENTKAVTENTRATESSSSTSGGTAPVTPVARAPQQSPLPPPKAKEQPWRSPFPQPEDGRYEVKWRDDEVVWADRGNGTWKLADGRAIDIKAWRARPK